MANINEKKLDTISALLKELYDGFAPRLDDEEITAGLQRLWRRSQEYRYGSFIMLVVGPVKSGKSTLVNLLAHRYVSPTDKLECTLRPTIISSVDPGAEPAIEIYSSKDEARKEKDLDLIIDKLRGIIEDDSELREHLKARIRAICDGVAAAFDARISLEFISGYIALMNTPAEAERVLRLGGALLGTENARLRESPSMGGEDFSYFVAKAPGAFWHLGCAAATPAPPLHNRAFAPDERCLPIGAALQAALVLDRMGMLEARRPLP